MVGTTVSTADIAPALADAKAWWAQTSIDTAALDGVTVVIADLSGLELGQTDGSVIRLDRNAAGWGWSLERRILGHRPASRARPRAGARPRALSR